MHWQQLWTATIPHFPHGILWNAGRLEKSCPCTVSLLLLLTLSTVISSHPASACTYSGPQVHLVRLSACWL